ncbi:MAG: pyruvate kinase [bacterium]
MHLGKKTKIVATIGPVTESKEQLKKMLKAGMNVMRMNFSHGDFAEHQGKFDNLKEAIKETGLPCAIMQDLSGPKFRIGDFYQERVNLKKGDFITLTPEKIVGDEKRVSINYPTLHEELKPGNIVMVDDGKKQFQVVEIKGKEIKCKILVGGETKGRRGVNLPGAYLKVSSLTEKDKKDIAFGIKNKVDIVAFSFVRTGDDVKELRNILNKAKSKSIILAKIETQEAVDNIDEIIALSDSIMVARGDLAVEIGYENTPLVQKMIIKKCNEAGKPVITATQMLDSMIKSPVPTRAEVSDIANAILDGTDAVMLSEESTLGDYPIEAVELMSRIALKVENSEHHAEMLWGIHAHHIGVGHSTTLAAMEAAEKVDAKYIVALTEYGYAARMVARNRGHQPILVMTPNPILFNQVCLMYGCYPIMLDNYKTFDEALFALKPLLQKNKLVSKGDKMVVVSGIPFGKTEESNVMLIETI